MAKTDRTGNRKRRESFTKRKPDMGYYSIITDTEETEKNYIYGFRDSFPEAVQKRLVIKVLETKTNELIKQSLDQALLEIPYSRVWIVFDRDRVVGFDDIIAEAERNGISVAWSNPCIEIWFDAYFGKMPAYQDSVACCKGFANTFETKTGQKYKKSDRQIYNKLKRYGDEDTAIRIAEEKLQGYKRDGVEKPSEMCPCTTVQKLILEIRQKIAQCT
ncbi:RloB family protein [Clostridium sp. D33t1_170424_F3]|uniref:RloB family protein n=1 Tax=Clostridium sp. D33t1_170424_F3 TaxID=2787099 RepID=UPI0018AACC42|nr:RloB family protein [Clostridium sp. D33t1_170424_F3]